MIDPLADVVTLLRPAATLSKVVGGAQAGLALNALPEELTTLTTLQQLDCSYTQVSDLTPLAGLSQLQRLDCSECRLGALPSAIRNNNALRLIA